MKKCPFCAEEIQEDAKKCRYCGEWLTHNETETISQNDYVYRKRDAFSYHDMKANRESIIELYSQGTMKPLDEIWDPEIKSWCYVKDCNLFKDVQPICSVSVMSSNVQQTSVQSAAIKPNTLQFIAGIAAFAIAASVTRYIGPASLLIIIPIILGVWFPSFYCKRWKDLTIINVIAYSNLVLWLIPALCLFTSIATLGFAKHVEQKRGLYNGLGFMGLILSIGLFLFVLMAGLIK